MHAEKPTHHVDHEGAEESSEPGQPASRKVIKPDWVELQDEERKDTRHDAPGGHADVPGDAAEDDKT